MAGWDKVVLEGQMSIFDFLPSVENTSSDISPKLDTSWDDMTEDELFEEIIKEYNLKKYDIEEWQIDLGEIENYGGDTRTVKTLKFKINQVDFKIGPFSYFAEDVRGGRRYVNCDYDYKKGGGGTPAESIAEVIDFIKRQSKNGKPAKKVDRHEEEPLKEDIETIEDKTAFWLWSDYLPYIVKQIMKTHSWLTESIRDFTYNNDKDYHKPLDILFTKTGFNKTNYNFMVDDTNFELAPSIYEEVYFIRCSKILDSEGNLLTQTNITAKDIVLELMKQPRPVHIKGICDDAYCPECDYELDERKELDCEKCPECGTLIDWTPWHRRNDKENESEEK